MGRLISWVVLGLFIVVVPLISWYYLKQGLDYRKNALHELLPKDSISQSLDTLGILKGKTTIIVLGEKAGVATLLQPIREQFKNAESFNVVSYYPIDGCIQLPEKYLEPLYTKYHQHSFVLIDTSMRIRNFYSDDMSDVRKMIEHIAIVLPRVKESDIKMKN